MYYFSTRIDIMWRQERPKDVIYSSGIGQYESNTKLPKKREILTYRAWK